MEPGRCEGDLMWNKRLKTVHHWLLVVVGIVILAYNAV